MQDTRWDVNILTVYPELFADEVINAIHVYHMLDARISDRKGNRLPMPQFTQSYLEYRVRSREHASNQYRVSSLFRDMVHDLVAENDALSYEDCVHLLCGHIAEGDQSHMIRRIFEDSSCELLLPESSAIDNDQCEYVPTHVSPLLGLIRKSIPCPCSSPLW